MLKTSYISRSSTLPCSWRKRPAAATGDRPVLAGVVGTPSRVLVVEDEVVNLNVLVALLQNLGYQVDAVANGLDAVDACARVMYDAVLMDCQLPQMDGFKATAWIRQREARSRRTPIIALTGADEPGDRERCLSAGMDDHLAKPVRLQTLDAALRKWVRRTAPAPAEVPAPVEVISNLPVDHPIRVLEAQGMASVVIEIIDLFLQAAPLRFRELRQAWSRGDAAGLVGYADFACQVNSPAMPIAYRE